MANPEANAAFGVWFNNHGSALSFIEEPFYGGYNAGWTARNAQVQRLAEQAQTARWQAESYLARARAELMPGVGLELCESALNHIIDSLDREKSS